GRRLRPPTRTQGEPRRIGVELEMNGLALDQLAELVADYLNLSIRPNGRYERVLSGDAAGEWGVELDFRLLKELGHKEREKGTLSGELADSAEEVLKWLADSLVPMELVSPPLPMARLDEVEELIRRLRAAGAKGTSDRLVNAFGMQFNPEVPDEGTETITAYLKAFTCLYDWLYARADINLSRQVTNYIDPYPTEYRRLLVRADYWPDQSKLIDDYLTQNPTRNRALDMLPLFTHLDEARVRRQLDDPLIKARPAFHYRLPDCEIHRPDWTLALAWNDWLEVEALANDAHRLAGCCRAYDEFLAAPLDRWFGDWVKQVEAQWLLR
ncbi:MAG: amidoligase family protein, partial [Natronospirillum sp.]